MSSWKSRRRVALALAVLAAAGTGAAYAAWTTTGSGPGKGKAARLSIIVTEPADLPAGSQELAPGLRGDVAVDVENTSRVGVSVTSWNAAGAVIRSANETSCPSSNVTFASQSASITPVPVAPGETKTVVLPNVLTMSSSAPDSCQGISFTVTPLRVFATA